MNEQILPMLASAGVSEIIFWILLILCAIGAVIPDAQSPYVNRGRWGIALILIAILGFKVFGMPK